MEPKIFVRKMLHFYEPITYQILFGEDGEPVAEDNLDKPVKLLTFPSNVSALRP